jgi:hypothetical protein
MIFAWIWRRQQKKMSRPLVDDVFTPGGEPSVTYVDREQLGLEKKIRSALQRRHSFIVVSGPTKCGKSVLCKRVLGNQPVVKVDGGMVTSVNEFWNLISHQLRLPTSATTTIARSGTETSLGEWSATVAGFFSGKASAAIAIMKQRSQAANYTNVLSLGSIVELRNRDATLLIEDFHYIEPATQRAILRALKSAVFDGLRVLILAVPHRAFDATEVEDEIEGRIEHVDVPAWSLNDLSEIAEKGFRALELEVAKNIQRRICEDGFGNPLLVQEICYELSENRLSRTSISADSPEGAELVSVYDGVARRKGLNRFEQLAHAPLPENAPLLRLRDQTQVNLNNAVLGAIARIGPKPTTSLEDIRTSLELLTEGTTVDREQVVSVLSTMTRAIAKGNAAPFEWEANRGVLNITDPFLMFYLRWALRDRRTVTLQSTAIDIARMLPPSPQTNEDEPR